tara:strand:- start:841 stop:3873 length:3033 start_codon:yes stop_codon:yes gene_type:complete
MKKFIIFALIVLMASSFASATMQDNFERADSTTLGTATNGNVWAETGAVGDWEILGYTMHGTGGGSSRYATLQFSASDPVDFSFNMSWDYPCAGTKHHLMTLSENGNIVGGELGVYIEWCKDGEAKFYSVAGGGYSAFDTSFTFAADTTYWVEFRDCDYITDDCEVWIDGVQYESELQFYDTGVVQDYISTRVWETGDEWTIGCIGTGTDCVEAAPSPPVTLNISDSLPANNSQFNTLLLNLNLTANASLTFDADLYINGVLNQSAQYGSGIDVFVDFNLTFLNTTEQTFTYFFSLNTTSDQKNTTVKTFHIDNVFPQITWYTPANLNTTIIADTLYSNIFLEDPNMFSYLYNITYPSGVQYYSSSNSTLTGLTNYTINDNVSLVGQQGVFYAYAEVCDGHTDQNMTIDSVEINNVTLEVEDEGDSISVSMVDEEDTESVSYIEEPNKVSFGFVTDTTTSSEQFIVESNNYIHILDGLTEYEGHLVMGKKWVDFETDDLKSVHIVRLTDYSVQVTVTKFTSTDEWDFESIGELNCRNQTRSFLVHVPTTGNNSQVLSGDISQYLLNVSMNSSFYTTANATLYWNGTGYPASATNTSTHFFFSTSITIPPLMVDTNVTYYWNYYLGTTAFNTTAENTTVYSPRVSNCTAYPTQWVEYLIKDETFETLLNGSITFLFDYYNGAYSNTFSGLSTGDSTFPMCMYPSWGNFSTNATIQYQTSEAGYTSREYQTIGFGVYESNRTVDLFLLEGATDITFHIIDDSDNNLEGVTVEAYRYRISTDEDVLVETEATDAEGKVILNLASGTTFYSFKIYDSEGVLSISTARFKLFSTEYEYIIQEGRENPLATRSNILNALTQTLVENNNQIDYTYNYTGELVNNWCFTVVANATTYNSQCDVSAAGNFTYTITQLNLTYLVTVTAYTNQSDYVVNNLEIDTSTQLKDVFGNTNTLFIALIMFLTIGLIGLMSANIAIVLSVLSLIIIGLFNLLPLSNTWITGAVALALGMLWVVNKR